jgi:hypothetical protein
MVAVALVAIGLGVGRASLPAGVGVAAILGMAAHRVRAVLRNTDAAGRPVGPVERVAIWADSMVVALMVVLGTGLAGLLSGLVLGIAFSGLAMVGEAIDAKLGRWLMQLGMLGTLLGSLAAMLWGARALRRSYWPEPAVPAPPESSAVGDLARL